MLSAESIYRWSNWSLLKKLPRISKLLVYINYLLHNSYIPASCIIGKDTKFAYGGISVVIHPNAIIGCHCMIGQGVTIGGKNGLTGLPVVEDNVFIGPGAVILGDIQIGHDSIIGANSVVLSSVTPYSVVAGAPAKQIGTITEKSFIEKYKHYYGPKGHM